MRDVAGMVGRYTLTAVVFVVLLTFIPALGALWAGPGAPGSGAPAPECGSCPSRVAVDEQGGRTDQPEGSRIATARVASATVTGGPGSKRRPETRPDPGPLSWNAAAALSAAAAFSSVQAP